MASKKIHSKPESLKLSRDFAELKKQGKRKVVSSWLMISHHKNTEGKIRFAVTASRKVGSAVIRNKLKRWCRDLVRQLASRSLNFAFDINFVFRPVNDVSFKKLEFKDFRSSVFPALETIFERYDEDC